MPKDPTPEQVLRMQVELKTIYPVELYPDVRAGPGESAACMLVTVAEEKQWMLEDATKHLWSRRQGQEDEALGEGSGLR